MVLGEERNARRAKRERGAAKGKEAPAMEAALLQNKETASRCATSLS
jgi:hypothetical protein